MKTLKILAIVFILSVFIASLFCSCSSRYITVESAANGNARCGQTLR